MNYKTANRYFILLGLFLFANLVHALPALQLGPGQDDGWSYDTSTDTWVLNGLGEIMAYANATKANGGNGAYAWATESEDKTAFLAVSAVPKTGEFDGDAFDISFSGSSGLTHVFSGWGIPLPDDPLAPHGIYATWYEVFEFKFDGNIGNIHNTQGDECTEECDPGQGYVESFNVLSFSSLLVDVDDNPLVTGIHFDLYTVNDGDIYRFAPFSHDAQMNIPEPGSLMLLVFGLLGLVMGRRRSLI